MIKDKFRAKAFFSHGIFLLGASGLLLLAIIVLWWDISRQPVISPSFAYSADSLVTKVFYDSQTGQAQPPHYSKISSRLVYKNENDRPTVRSTLAVTDSHSTVDSTQTYRPIDASTGVYKDGEKPGEEYILAPRGLAKDQAFYYSHPSFSKPGRMEYRAEETIGDLRVFQYDSSFDGAVYLPSIQDKLVREGQVSPLYTYRVKLWVEPVSGWIVKYYTEVDVRLSDTVSTQPKTYAYINEVMTDESVAQHIAYASTQKLKFNFVKHVVPSVLSSVLFVVIFVVLVMKVKTRRIPIYGASGLVMAAGSATLIGWVIEAEPLTTFFASRVSTNPLTAVCFIMAGLAIIALYRRMHPVAAVIGVIMSVLASLQLLYMLGVVSFSIDLFIFKDAILDLNPTIYSRMSAYIAFTFLLLGIGLVKAGLSSKKSKIHFARFVVGIVLTLSILGILLKITAVERLLTVEFTDPFSILPWCLFAICSFTLLQLFRTLNDIPDTIMHTIYAVRWPVAATVPLVLIGMWTQLEKNAIVTELQESFNQRVASFEQGLTERSEVYTSALAGVKGLFVASQVVTREEFKHYVDIYLEDHHVGIRQVGFAPWDSTSSSAKVDFLESLDTQDIRYRGYNLESDVTLKSVLGIARDSGRVIMSNKSPSLRDADEAHAQAFLISPIYANGQPTATVEERRQALKGFVFLSIDIQQLLSHLQQTNLEDITMNAYDGVSTVRESRLYGQSDVGHHIPDITKKQTLFIANRLWTIEYTAQPSFGLGHLREVVPTLILFGGTAAYFAGLAITYFVIKIRRQRYNGSDRREH